jgi:hypothetical protein
VFFGSTQPIETPDMVGLLDPQLPAWIHESVAAAVPDMLARYTRELGPPPGVKPTIMLSWAGPTTRTGQPRRERTPRADRADLRRIRCARRRSRARIDGLRFIAHEAAHFWLGQTVAYEFARDAWITEGGADLLAMRLMAEEHASYDWHAEINRSIEDCVNLTRRRGIEGARERNESRAYYACGAVFGLVAESASGKPFFAFVKTLVDSNRG